MSQGEQTKMACRRCGEPIPVQSENCPHCGTSTRGRNGPIIAFVAGIVMAAASLFNLGDLLFFGVIGVIMAAFAGYLLYDRRERIREVAGREDVQEESEDESAAQLSDIVEGSK